MATKIIPQTILETNIAAAVFSAVENEMPDNDAAFYAALGAIKHLITPEQYCKRQQ